jgi:hypothetical protein
VPGEVLKLQHQVKLGVNLPVTWVTVRYPTLKREIKQSIALENGVEVSRDAEQTLPAGMPLSQPYWLRKPGTDGMFRVDDPKLIVEPENLPEFPVEYVFEIDGQTLVLAD